MDKIFDLQLGRNLEVYVDDMVIKSDDLLVHIKDLKEVFGQFWKHNMRLNLEKLVFMVEKGSS